VTEIEGGATFWILGHGQLSYRQGAEHCNQDRNHPRENGPVDEKALPWMLPYLVSA